VAFWRQKFDRNVERDAENMRALTSGGWKVMEVWECELRDTAALARRLSRFLGPVRPKDGAKA
jgi:DNA mismatch endonuclease (patch repair protein)